MVSEEPAQLQQVEAAIQDDMLETIFSHVPLVDLVSAWHVCKSWNRAVSSSLRNFNKLKPWLFVHTQSTRYPYKTTTHAYDPRSHVWMDISQPSIDYVSALRSSNSNLLYMLSPSKLSFSMDPLHLTWRHTCGPLVWRTDPIVALVGHRVIVAGGTCEFEDDPLAVEIYDTKSNMWETCESMPAILKDSAASTWLSVATDGNKLFMTEKYSGVTYWFDPEISIWYGPYDLRPDPCVFYSVIGFCNDRLIMIGLIGDGENIAGMKLWEVNCESFECEEVAEMPIALITKLKSENFRVSSIGVCLAGNLVCIYNPSEIEELFVCEFVNGGYMWDSIPNVAAIDRNLMERFVFTCSDVRIDELRRAMESENWKFNCKI